jgi:hypothetical protein
MIPDWAKPIELNSVTNREAKPIRVNDVMDNASYQDPQQSLNALTLRAVYS